MLDREIIQNGLVYLKIIIILARLLECHGALIENQDRRWIPKITTKNVRRVNASWIDWYFLYLNPLLVRFACHLLCFFFLLQGNVNTCVWKGRQIHTRFRRVSSNLFSASVINLPELLLAVVLLELEDITSSFATFVGSNCLDFFFLNNNIKSR